LQRVPLDERSALAVAHPRGPVQHSEHELQTVRDDPIPNSLLLLDAVRSDSASPPVHDEPGPNPGARGSSASARAPQYRANISDARASRSRLLTPSPGSPRPDTCQTTTLTIGRGAPASPASETLTPRPVPSPVRDRDGLTPAERNVSGRRPSLVRTTRRTSLFHHGRTRDPAAPFLTRAVRPPLCVSHPAAVG